MAVGFTTFKLCGYHTDMATTLKDMLKSSVSPLALVRARSKVLAREDRKMRAELVRLRREQNLSQAAIAKQLGVSQQAIYKLERYDADPKLSTLRRYANAVGAIIEHNVTPDLGQSLSLAQTTRWENSGKLESQAGSVHMLATPASPSSGQWSASKRTDYALLA